MPRRDEAFFHIGVHYVPEPLPVIREAFAEFDEGGWGCVWIATEGRKNEMGVAAAVIRELWRLRWCDISAWTVTSSHRSAIRALTETPDAVQSAYEGMREVFHASWLDRTYPAWDDRVVTRGECGILRAESPDFPGCYALGTTGTEVWDRLIEVVVRWHADA